MTLYQLPNERTLYRVESRLTSDFIQCAMSDNQVKGSKRQINPNRVRKSASYRSALSRSASILKKPEKLGKLIAEASAKAARLGSGPLIELKSGLYSLFRLVKAYSRGDYREISWANLVLVVSAIVYFVTPFDLVPDFLMAMGYLDDAAILSWTLKALTDEIENFRLWEDAQNAKASTPPDLAED